MARRPADTSSADRPDDLHEQLLSLHEIERLGVRVNARRTSVDGTLLRETSRALDLLMLGGGTFAAIMCVRTEHGLEVVGGGDSLLVVRRLLVRALDRGDLQWAALVAARLRFQVTSSSDRRAIEAMVEQRQDAARERSAGGRGSAGAGSGRRAAKRAGFLRRRGGASLRAALGA